MCAALAARCAPGREPLRPLLDDVAHPEERLDMVDQRRSPEQPDLRRKGRLVARQSAAPLDAFEHRRFFAADIGAGAAPEMDLGVRREPRRLDRGDLARQDLAALRVFVAQIDEDVPGLDSPGGDQHALQEAMRIGFEKIAVLERAGLALIGIDRHQPRLWLLPHKAPFAPGRKTGAAQAAQAGILKRLDDVLDWILSVEAGLQQLVTTRSAI